MVSSVRRRDSLVVARLLSRLWEADLPQRFGDRTLATDGPLCLASAEWWQLMGAVCRSLDGFQRRRVALIWGSHRYPGEVDEALCDRRVRVVAATCRARGLWSPSLLSGGMTMCPDRGRIHGTGRRSLQFGSAHRWCADQRLPARAAPHPSRGAAPGQKALRWHDAAAVARVVSRG